MKSSTAGKKKSSSSSRSKNYSGHQGNNMDCWLSPAFFLFKAQKDVADLNNAAMPNYKGDKFLRGRKYSFSSNRKDKKNNDNSKVNTSAHIKYKNSKANVQMMMLNINCDGPGAI